MRLKLTLAAALLVAVALGCSSQSRAPVAPRQAATVTALHLGSSLSAVYAAGGVYERTVACGKLYRLPDGTGVVVAAPKQAAADARGVNLQRVSVGTITVVCVCSYPLNFVGPLPSGYGYVDGSGCN